MAVFTLLDLLGIQEFIFASNRLKDVVGGSMLVQQVADRDGWLTRMGVAFEALVAAGGNALLKFNSMGEAESFAARYSRKLLEEAPGLAAVVVHKEVSEGNAAETILELHQMMAEEKARRRPSLELPSLGVTERCRETGWVASEVLDRVPVTRSVVVRREILKELDLTVRSAFTVPGGPADSSCLRFPVENDELGRTPGQKSLLGVVHVDANGVGQRIATWFHQQIESRNPDGPVETQYSEISKSLTEVVKKAWENVKDRTEQSIEWRNDGKGSYQVVSGGLNRGFKLYEKNRVLYLPLRPILLGGDDLTFLCDGRIALDLAETALHCFETTAIRELGPVGACAGVAIVHVHAPFIRAAEWASRLCSQAKDLLRRNQSEPSSECALDWHVGLPNPQETVADLRERVYTLGVDGQRLNLTCRPYPLGQRDIRETWRWLSRNVLGARFLNHLHSSEGLRGEVWSQHRNKVKRLAVLAREGKEAVQESLRGWQIVDENLKLPGDLAGSAGFLGDRTPLLDAVELMDLHWPLDRLPGSAAPRGKA